MGLFTNIEKKIAGAITSGFNKAEVEVGKIEATLTADIKKSFDSARAEALAANGIVAKLKADLQAALVRSRDLHQIAVDAATAAQAAAEADAARFKSLAAAHAVDLATQASQIVEQPQTVNTDTQQ